MSRECPYPWLLVTRHALVADRPILIAWTPNKTCFGSIVGNAGALSTSRTRKLTRTKRTVRPLAAVTSNLDRTTEGVRQQAVSPMSAVMPDSQDEARITAWGNHQDHM
jgi:hypothetical protein